MRQVSVREFGPPSVLEVVDAPDPTPGPGEVLVDVKAAHVLWVETAVRRGDGRDWFPLRAPYVPGTGVAGLEVGTGRRVVGHTGLGGGYADRVVVDADRLVALPDEVGFGAAAALVHDATTAQALFEVLQVDRQDHVLVIGASGGLGLVSLQLARRRARSVVALARDGRKIARIDALGFDVVDTEAPDWPSAVRERLPDGADVVLDNVGGALGAQAVPLLAYGGRWSAHGRPGGSFSSIDEEQLTARGQRVVGLSAAQLPPERRTRLIAEGLAMAARGELTPVVGQTFPLEKAADAHAAIEQRTVFGATLLVP